MEPDFISELDKTLSNVGTDVFWKRKIGKLELWISPLSITGQEKVTAAVNKAEIDTNIVGESKRVTLANSIVGVNDSDLRAYRGGAPVFQSLNKKGEVVKVQLEQYLYNKMANWSAQYIDDVFSVYADLMESFQKANLQEIKFENAKDPHIELQELESRVAALRSQLGLLPLAEKNNEEVTYTPEQVAEMLEKERQEAEKQEEQEDFDPFKAVPQTPPVPRPQPKAPAPAPVPVQQQVQSVPEPPPFEPPPSGPPQPNYSMPATLPQNLQRPMPLGHSPESTPENPYQAMPSVPNEVITQPTSRRGAFPKIDQPPQNVNPRFSPPGGGRPIR